MKILPTDLSKNEIKEIGEREQKRGVRLRIFDVGREGILLRSAFGRTPDTWIYSHISEQNLRNAVELLN